MASVWVLNTTDEPFEDMFDGVKYRFPPGKSVEVSDVVAQHIFGYQSENKEKHLIRLGWTRLSTDIPAALERLAKFRVSDKPLSDHHYPSPVVGRIPLPPTKGEGGKGTPKVA